MDPGFAQWAVTSRPSGNKTSLRKRLYLRISFARIKGD